MFIHFKIVKKVMSYLLTDPQGLYGENYQFLQAVALIAFSSF